MKRILPSISKILLLVLCLVPMLAFAGAREDYKEAQSLLVAARACLAIYNDRAGKLSTEYLKQDGWEIEPYIQPGELDDARFLIAKKELGDGSQPIYLLAIVGTETSKNIKTDLKMHRVYFAGHTLEEFTASAALKNIPDSEPKVHLGFHNYVQTALKAKSAEHDNRGKLLTELLLENADRKIYLTGHSLGGAVATLTGARLLSMGVKPEQVEVISFGAPAVGNQAFVDVASPKLRVTRVVIDGDPVTGVLQTLSDYKQFGREVKWVSSDKTHKGQHAMVGYLDTAIKNFYQKREQAEQEGQAELIPQSAVTGNTAKVYVMPAKNYLTEDLKSEFWYMQQGVVDNYRLLLPNAVFADADAEPLPLKRAAEMGCRWLIVPEISAHKLKNERNLYYITLQQTVYDTANGKIIYFNNNSTSTASVTPLEALLHNIREIGAETGKWLEDPK
ncbi:hypothetical protein SRRS_42270 [Sporomusa rhizae]|uniref:lipase family protein n=1 Tax=Sporomusa rhizae TaxID=357999 RepID=UPI00352A8912